MRRRILVKRMRREALMLKKRFREWSKGLLAVAFLLGGVVWFIHTRPAYIEQQKFDSACRAFQSANLPSGTTLLASQVFLRGDPIQEGTRSDFTMCMAVYQYTGSKSHFQKAMEQRIQKLKLPEGDLIPETEDAFKYASTALSFPGDKPRDPAFHYDSNWDNALLWCRINGWAGMQSAMEKPKTCFADYTICEWDRDWD